MRHVLSFLNASTLNQPEVYLQTTPDLINEDGEITNEGTVEFLTGWLAAFQAHIEKTRG